MIQKIEITSIDSVKYALYDSLTTELEEIDRVKAIDYLKGQLALGMRMKSDKKMAATAARLASNYMFSGLNDSAQVYLVLADRLYTELDDLQGLNENLNNMALLYQRLNRYEDAVSTYQKVITISDSLSDYIGVLFANVNLMSVFMDIEDPDKALEYFNDIVRFLAEIPKKEVAILKEIQNYRSAVYLNAGQCYEELGQLDSAMVYFQQASRDLENVEYEYSKTYYGAYIDHSIGNVYYKKSESQKDSSRTYQLRAFQYYQKAYEAFESITNDRGRAIALNDVGKTLNDLGQFYKANQILNDALSISQRLDFKEEIRDSYEHLAKNAENERKYALSNQYLRKWVSYRDSIRNEERDKLIQSQQIKYETTKKEKEIIELAYQNELTTKQQTIQRIIFLVSTLFLLGLAAAIFTRYRYVKQKEKIQFEMNINRAMARFVPMDFIRAIGREKITDVQLGDQIDMEMTVVFTDIRSFTTISEGMTPKENFNFVKEYAGRMGPIIARHNGFISQYLGDGIMAIFKSSSSDALMACIEMQQEVSRYNQELEAQGRMPIKVGMGMHTGSLVMGIIGDDLRLDATLISDTVNTAARIESTTKEFGVEILLSEQSKNGLVRPERFNLMPKGEIRVKGKTVPIIIYECSTELMS